MLLGNESYFTKEHYITNKGTAPEYLCELVVYCMELVSQLSHHKLDYRFKGGNSLLILLEDPQRFSIDVDIVTTETKENLIDLVNKITETCEIFTKCEVRQHKTKPWLPMISFKLFFNSFFQAPEESYVMLDAVLEEPAYEGITKQVKCLDLYSSSEQVEVPSISGLIADKLLTIGPSTLGIPLGKNKEAQRLKHIFDVSLLSKNKYDLSIIKKSLKSCITQENKLQRSSFKWTEIKKDTIDFCSEALKFNEKPELNGIENDSYLYEIVKGFDDFKKHLFKIDYTWSIFKNDCNNILELIDHI